MLEKDFKKIISGIKEEIINTQIKTMQQVNSNLIMLYYRLGKIVFEHKTYGNNFTTQISVELKLTFPNIKGFSERNIRSMRLFYEEYKDDEKWQQLVAKLPWGHNLLLIEKIKDKNIRKVYAENTIKNGWSRNVLALQIESGFHNRIGASNNNFQTLLPPNNSDLVNNTIKDPYIFDFITLKEEYKEKELENAMIEKIRNVLLELGKGFSFVGNQYKVSVDNENFYMDLLFYHLDLRCYIVVELKVNEFKPDYIGQLGFYVTAIDETIKKEYDNPTVGLLLCRGKNRLTVDWSLKSSNVPIGVSSYELNNQIPKELLNKLPTEEEINMYINFDEQGTNDE
ncbi:MAG: PDDEXK nuclease domain-containing protein [Bacilli bacterium]